MEYVPKHTTENHFLMVKSWWFVMFVMVFVVETIRIFCDGFYCFFQQGLSLVIHKMNVSSYHHFESQKRHIRQHKINTRGFWWYIEVLWSETIGLSKKLNIIYNITCNPGESWFFLANWFFRTVCFNELVQFTRL